MIPMDQRELPERRHIRWTAPLSKRNRDALCAIRSLIERNGRAPSYVEIAAEMGLSAISTVHGHVHVLAKHGLIVLDGPAHRISAAVEVDA